MKIKILQVATLLGASAIFTASIVSAQAVPATATCVGTVSGANITWTATATGGTSPYSYVWTGIPNITGHNAASFTETYNTNGTYNASVAVSDSASPAATVTANCSATVTTVVAAQPQTTPDYSKMVKQPIVNINPEGKILIHGMTVTSVGTNSFQGTVWGINYTVNLTGNAVPMLLFRNGNEAAAGIQPVKQLKVGDEVGVSGSITAAAPLAIDGDIVRNYSISIPRPDTEGESEGAGNSTIGNKTNEGEGNNMMGGGENENEGGNNMMNTGNNGNVDQQALLSQLLQQVQALQKQFQEKFGTSPSTNSTGNQ